MSIADVRGLFPGVSERIYLDLSLNALVPSPARDAVLTHLEERVMGRAVKRELHARAERVREGVARLLGAEPDEIAITKNVSEGLNLFSASLPWRAGDNVIFCPELEHPNNVFLWYNLARNRGIEAREVPPVDGRIPVERMVASMDDRTRVVTASHVTFSQLHEHLTDHGVRLSIRRGVLRMSLGIYNTEEEVDRVVELCRGWTRAAGRSAR